MLHPPETLCTQEKNAWNIGGDGHNSPVHLKKPLDQVIQCEQTDQDGFSHQQFDWPRKQGEKEQYYILKP